MSSIALQMDDKVDCNPKSVRMFLHNRSEDIPDFVMNSIVSQMGDELHCHPKYVREILKVCGGCTILLVILMVWVDRSNTLAKQTSHSSQNLLDSSYYSSMFFKTNLKIETICNGINDEHMHCERSRTFSDGFNCISNTRLENSVPKNLLGWMAR